MPPTRESASPSAKAAVIALDLGGTKLAACLFFSTGRLIARMEQHLAEREGSEVGELILESIRSLQREASRRRYNVRAIGICVPGVASSRSGQVWAPNIPGWEDFPLRATVKKSLDNSQIKVVVENDRAASILGEAWQGAARGCRNAVFLAVGTGIGAGILVDGKVLRGAHGIAGAIGWLALERPFQSDYATSGCFESHASGQGIVKVAKTELARRRRYRGVLRSKSQLTAQDVFAAFEGGDPIAKKVLLQAIEYWGMASANLVSLFNPEVIVFGGGVFGPAVQFLDAIAAEARRWAQPVAMKHVKFQVSTLAGGAALYGSAYAALRQARLPVS